MPGHLGDVSLKKSRDIIISSFCTIVKGQAKYYKMMILQFFRLTAPRCPGMAAGALSLRKSHDIVIFSFCNIVKGAHRGKNQPVPLWGIKAFC